MDILNNWLMYYMQSLIFYPPLIYIVLTVLVYIMWLFGTDWYDSFKKLWRNSLHFMKMNFWWLLIFNTIGLFFKSQFVLGVCNTWCLLVLVVYAVKLTIYELHKFNAWCLDKRGKK